jgi:RecA/RadA recombinase
MAEAKINLQITPAEFDLLRRELSGASDAYQQVANNSQVEVSQRNQAREAAGMIENFLARLR